MMATNRHLDVDTQAAQWAARMLSGEMTADESMALERWRKEDDGNTRSLEQLVDMVDALDAAGEAMLEANFIAELEEQSSASLSRRRFLGMSGMAAGIAAAAVTGMIFYSPAPTREYYETRKGQRSTVYLSDGSVVQLNTDSRVSALVGGDVREVTIERGEAFFDVKRDESRPFRVFAGDTQVQVLGTRFGVRMGASSNLVCVLSGLVAVGQRGDTAGAVQEMALLHAGERVVHNLSARSATVETFDTGRAFAWRTGKARYNETPLADVVADLNRYFRSPLEIADDELAVLPVTGTFTLNDQDTVVDALESAFSLMAVRRADGVILLYARQDQ
ncbi:MAG: DUF4974 domain-containing protein [Alphaproteobacteria bacterium]|nr:MAG: DUF4974 domain-containing protein [Alphaproteobacteria bacterium]